MSLTRGETVKEFYDGAEIFITGASGFIGKVLIEKLLRSCTRIKTIYILMRSKKNKSASERLQDLTDSLLFDILKEENPECFEKLQVIEGDIIELNLGISKADLEKLKSCSVIFHSAASVRFDDPIKKAILLNTRATREVCKLATTMHNLKALIHVSTAYVQPKNSFVEEKLYPSEADWKYYIKFAEEMDAGLLNSLVLKMTSFAPNTYTFTKHLAEHVCNDYRKEFNLPVVIYRPSIVSLSEVEPMAGWCDNLNGPMGIALVSALALSHVNLMKDSDFIDVVPVDICVKGMIITAWKHGKTKNSSLTSRFSDIPIYNASSIKSCTYYSMAVTIDEILAKHPSNYIFGIPDVTFTRCIAYAWLIRLFRQIIPALIIDALLRISGNKARLLNIQRIIFGSHVSLKYFYSRSFNFTNFKFLDLNLDLTQHECEEFGIIEKSSSKLEYYENGIKMANRFFLKETDEDEKKAKRRYPYVYFVTRLIHVVVIYLVVKLFNALIYGYI